MDQEAKEKGLFGFTFHQIIILIILISVICVVLVIFSFLIGNSPIMATQNETTTPNFTHTPDTRERISNCLPWQLLDEGDIGKEVCVAAVTYSSRLYRDNNYDFGGSCIDVMLVSFKDSNENPIKRFYIVADLEVGTSEGPTQWKYFRNKYSILDKNGLCVGIRGKVYMRRFYKDDPTQTYYIEIDPSTLIVTFSDCQY